MARIELKVNGEYRCTGPIENLPLQEEQQPAIGIIKKDLSQSPLFECEYAEATDRQIFCNAPQLATDDDLDVAVQNLGDLVAFSPMDVHQQNLTVSREQFSTAFKRLELMVNATRSEIPCKYFQGTNFNQVKFDDDHR